MVAPQDLPIVNNMARLEVSDDGENLMPALTLAPPLDSLTTNDECVDMDIEHMVGDDVNQDSNQLCDGLLEGNEELGPLGDPEEMADGTFTQGNMVEAHAIAPAAGADDALPSWRPPQDRSSAYALGAAPSNQVQAQGTAPAVAAMQEIDDITHTATASFFSQEPHGYWASSERGAEIIARILREEPDGETTNANGELHQVLMRAFRNYGLRLHHYLPRNYQEGVEGDMLCLQYLPIFRGPVPSEVLTEMMFQERYPSCTPEQLFQITYPMASANEILAAMQLPHGMKYARLAYLIKMLGQKLGTRDEIQSLEDHKSIEYYFNQLYRWLDQVESHPMTSEEDRQVSFNAVSAFILSLDAVVNERNEIWMAAMELY